MASTIFSTIKNRIYSLSTFSEREAIKKELRLSSDLKQMANKSEESDGEKTAILINVPSEKELKNKSFKNNFFENLINISNKSKDGNNEIILVDHYGNADDFKNEFTAYLNNNHDNKYQLNTNKLEIDDENVDKLTTVTEKDKNPAKTKAENLRKVAEAVKDGKLREVRKDVSSGTNNGNIPTGNDTVDVSSNLNFGSILFKEFGQRRQIVNFDNKNLLKENQGFSRSQASNLDSTSKDDLQPSLISFNLTLKHREDEEEEDTDDDSEKTPLISNMQQDNDDKEEDNISQHSQNINKIESVASASSSDTLPNNGSDSETLLQAPPLSSPLTSVQPTNSTHTSLTSLKGISGNSSSADKYVSNTVTGLSSPIIIKTSSSAIQTAVGKILVEIYNTVESQKREKINDFLALLIIAPIAFIKGITSLDVDNKLQYSFESDENCRNFVNELIGQYEKFIIRKDFTIEKINNITASHYLESIIKQLTPYK